MAHDRGVRNIRKTDRTRKRISMQVIFIITIPGPELVGTGMAEEKCPACFCRALRPGLNHVMLMLSYWRFSPPKFGLQLYHHYYRWTNVAIRTLYALGPLQAQ
ncbi:hypothetical protein SERLA73DRAFT_189550 [Serpula lacrymans var. lacrymans S7.3]|uniref:Uncharacterized protein n=1 Tax=Serpula lacrymans var. lacrymans (strain S7.3) TaxID=936435 RepID=F8QDW7_SERL3|nr:hypothetical protein SERLA73DRAFT_189550 [Serpula lacrymans var. lacrymans S7.3]